MTNPLTENLKIPGEIVRLPSGGGFYEEGVLDPTVINAEISVYPMSAYDEICMRNVGEIINGRSVSNVFARCIPQILKPDELLGKDVDMLFMVLRKVTYGSSMTINYKHDCEEAKTHKYNIILANLINATKYLDSSLIDEEYSTSLPNGQHVQLQPLKYKDILTIMSDARDHDTLSQLEMQNKLLDSTSHLIKSVDGVTEKEHILEWLRTIPSSWYSMITDKSSLHTQWGSENSYTIKCEDCGSDITIDVPINPLTFFLDF
jgi:hypothetical protein